VRDGTAVIPIDGPIFRRANLFTEISGATSTEILATDLQSAIDNSLVRRIVLEIDSPGGEATGIAELAAMIHASPKPITAYVDGIGASAAYWLAAAAHEMVVSSTALVGSIGVVASYRPETDGPIKVISTQSPLKQASPDTKAGRAETQRVIDELAAVFIADVARYRATDPETVMRDFGRGGLLVGAAAVAASMADRVGTFESLFTDTDRPSVRRPAMSAQATDPAPLEAPATDPTPEPEPEPTPAPEPDAEPLAATLETREATEYLALPIDIKTDDIPAVVNAALAALGHGPYDMTPSIPAMDARALAVDCQTAGFPALAADLIASAATAPQVAARLALARDLKNRLAGAQQPDLFQPLLDALLKDPVHAVALALSYALEAGEPVIRSDHNGQTAPAARPLNVLDIQAARKAQTTKRR